MKPFHFLSALLILASTSASAGQVMTEEDALKLATDAIHKYHLTTLKDECGLADVIEKPSYFEVVVHERHTQSCGGAPETAPRLFNVRVRKRDGRLTSDVYDGVSYKPVDRELRPVKKSGQPR